MSSAKLMDPVEFGKKISNFHLPTYRYQQLYAASIAKPELFWAEQATTYLSWIKKWDRVLTGDFNCLPIEWFKGGVLNAAYNCLDRHLPDRQDQIAIFWEGNDPQDARALSYKELHEQVCGFANVLKNQGIKKGDRVCIYLPMIPEAIVAMLACARIGAIHSVVFGGFSAEALKARLENATCSLVITANESVRGNKIIPLKKNVDSALKHLNDSVIKVIVVERTLTSVPWQAGRDHWYHELMQSVERNCPIEPMLATDPLFILYTSGSTGKPKGILHSTAGYLLHVAMTHHLIFDYHPAEVYWCTADIGWITGHSYGVYGPLLNGATIVLFEGVPTFPTPSRYWEIIDKYHVNIFYTAPTAIRALRGEGDHWVQRTSRASLRILGSVGEPINPEAWQWYYDVVGKKRCPIVDTWWQTETGGIMISPLPAMSAPKPGAATWPFFGVVSKIVDEKGQEVPEGTMGQLVITQPWPGMLQTVYGDQARFMATYLQPFPGVYLTGDLAYQDAEGYLWIAGRSDDVIKISGHRIGTQEVESALIQHPAVSEAAVVPIADAVKGQAIYAYVTLKSGSNYSEIISNELREKVREVIGAIAVPSHIQCVDNLPKTRSGKILRRLLKKIANKELEELGDLSTLADPEVVQRLIKNS